MKRLFVVIMVIAPLVVAQAPREERREELREETKKGSTVPEPRAVGVILPKAITVDLSEKDKKGSISGNFRQGNIILSSKLTAPFEDVDEPVVFGDLTGLTAKTSAEASLTYLSWKPRIDRPRFLAACRALENGRRRFKQKELLGEGELVGCRDDEFASATEIAAADLEAARKLLDGSFDKGTVWLYSFAGEGGRQNYKWIDRADLSEKKESQTSRAFTFSVSTLRKNDDYISLAYRKATNYEGGKPTQLCSPLADGSTSLVCKQTSLDGPTQKDAEVVILQYRRFITDSLAISPKIARDLKDNITQIDLPIYVFKNNDGALMGGAAASWRSDEKEVTARVFIGATLKLIGD